MYRGEAASKRQDVSFGDAFLEDADAFGGAWEEKEFFASCWLDEGVLQEENVLQSKEENAAYCTSASAEAYLKASGEEALDLGLEQGPWAELEEALLKETVVLEHWEGHFLGSLNEGAEVDGLALGHVLALTKALLIFEALQTGAYLRCSF